MNYAEQALRHATDDLPGADRRRRGRRPGRDLLGDAPRPGRAPSPPRCAGSACGRGDRVAGYLPNVPEAVVAFLGAASIGAVWSSCAPDFGTRAVLDRFAQIEPTVLVAVDGYRFNGKEYDRRDVVAELRAALPTVRTTIAVPRLHPDELPDGALAWADAVADECEPEFARAAVRPPAVDRLLVGHHRAAQGDRARARRAGARAAQEPRAAPGRAAPATGSSGTPRPPGSCGTCATSALLVGATVVVYDGAPAYPALDAQFALAARTGITYLGTSAGYLTACEKAGIRPGDDPRPVGAADPRRRPDRRCRPRRSAGSTTR